MKTLKLPIGSLVLIFAFFLGTGFSWAQAPVSLEDLLNSEIETASKYEQTVREAPASVTLVTAEEIERFGYQNLAEVLNQVRGFYTSNDRNYGYLGVRGFSRPTDYNSRVLLMINGQVTNENFYGSAAISNAFGLSMDSVEKIEVIRGPGSALYGSGAVFAVINVITKKGIAVDGLEFSGESGSFGEKRTSGLFGKHFANGVDLMVSGHWGDLDGEDLYFAEFDDSESNNGIAEDVDYDEFYGGFVSLGYKKLQLQGYLTSRRKGIPTAPYEIDFNASESRTLDENLAFDARYSLDLGPGKELLLRGYFNHYYYDGVYPYEGFQTFDDNRGDWWGVESRFGWEVSAANRLIVGAEFQDNPRAQYRSFDEDDFFYFDQDIPFDVTSVYVQDSHQVTERLSLTGGLRFDDYSDVGSATSPRLAVVYHPFEGSTLKALYGEAFRRPNHYEVYFQDAEFGTAAPNPNLKPEEIRTTELIWEQQFSENLAGTVSFYNYDMENLISGVVIDGDSLVQFQNLDAVDALGAELELNLRLRNGVWGYASYAVQETEDQTTNLQLSNSPKHIVRLGASMPLVPHLNGAVQLRYESERTTVLETELDSYLLTDLHLVTEPLFGRVQLSLHVFNLFDESYSVPGGFEHAQDGIIQDGRNLRFGIRLTH